jgi:hypothetical protein
MTSTLLAEREASSFDLFLLMFEEQLSILAWKIEFSTTMPGSGELSVPFTVWEPFISFKEASR